MSGARTTPGVHFQRGPTGSSRIRPRIHWRVKCENAWASWLPWPRWPPESACSVAAAAAGTPHRSAVVGHTYVNDNAAGDKHHRRVRPACRRLPDPDSGFAVRHRWCRVRVPVSARRVRSSRARTTGSCWRWTPEAIRSRCCASIAGAFPSRSAPPSPRAGVKPVSIAVNRFGLVYVANVGDGGSNYAGFFLTHGGRLLPLPDTTVPVPEGSGCRRRAVQLHR